jgi:hypothetical protein
VDGCGDLVVAVAVAIGVVVSVMATAGRCPLAPFPLGRAYGGPIWSGGPVESGRCEGGGVKTDFEPDQVMVG